MKPPALVLALALMTATISAFAGAPPTRRPTTTAPTLTDARIRKILIAESIAAYPGNCPCPHNAARNGSTCGGRSAYSRPGGAAPLCYPKDVTDEMVREYRETHEEAK